MSISVVLADLLVKASGDYSLFGVIIYGYILFLQFSVDHTHISLKICINNLSENCKVYRDKNELFLWILKG